jgi:uncharacterized protein involved in exopolysaccharide biosynthesis
MKRLMRRLTTPQELLYALSHHWMLVFSCLVLGTSILLGKALTEPSIYQGQATLMITPGDAMSLELGGEGRAYQGREQFRAFFSSRVDMLTTESVLRKVVEVLKPANIIAQDENPEEKEYGRIRGLVNRLKRDFSRFLADLRPKEMADVSLESETQKAISSFRARVAVVPDLNTGTVKMTVFGVYRDQILQEINQWIDEYVIRLVEVLKESTDVFISSRLAYWEGEEAKARKALEESKNSAKESLPLPQGEKLEISPETRDMLFQKFVQLQMLYWSLQNQDFGGTLSPQAGAGPAGRSDIDRLMDDKIALDRELRDALARHPPQSDIVTRVEEKLRLVQSRLDGTGEGYSRDPEERKKKLQARLDQLLQSISQTSTLHSAVGRALEGVKELEEDVSHAREWREKFEALKYDSASREDSRKNIQVQLCDTPHEGWKRINSPPEKKALLGALGGLGVGIFLALVLEMANGRVRFRNDVLGEIGLPVVGVLPRK